jgi:hypothetical protein
MDLTVYFLLSLPIGGISAAVIILFLRIPPNPDSGKSFTKRFLELDLFGAFVLVPAIVCILLALQWGGSTYPWNSSRIIGLFVGFGVLIIIFIISQIRLGERATLPPRILSQRTVVAAVTFAFTFGAAFFLLLFYLPIYFQSVKGVSATRSGIQILPLSLGTVLMSVISGALITVVGYYTPILIFGTVLFTIGSGLISTYTINMPFGKWFGYQVLAGLGAGVGFQIPLIAVQTVLPVDDIPIGTTAVIFFQTMGSALFISVGQSVFANGVRRGVNQFAPWLDPNELLKAGATDIRKLLQDMGRSANLQDVLMGYMVGLKDTYRVAIACTALSVVAACLFEWKSVTSEEVKRKEAAGGAHVSVA